MEQARLGATGGNPTTFFDRPIAGTLAAVTIFIWLWPLARLAIRWWRGVRSLQNQDRFGAWISGPDRNARGLAH